MITHKLKINLFGESRKLKKISFTVNQKSYCETIAKRMKLPLYKAIIDPYFYHLWNDAKIQSMADLEIIVWEELLNNPKNQIEIWCKNKKIQKLKINDLLDELLLFPLYNSVQAAIPSIKEKGIYVEQKEIGLMGSYEMYIENFNIDDLVFHMSKRDDATNLHKLSYQKKDFVVKKIDTLMTYQNSFEI